MRSRSAGPSVALDQPLFFERPDGFYWQVPGGGREYGPFASLRDAEADSEGADLGQGGAQDLLQAENELGIADWIDTETGQPAEDSVPHLEDDVV